MKEAEEFFSNLQNNSRAIMSDFRRYYNGYEWAKAQQPVQAGDRVVINGVADTIRGDKTHGWRSYLEALEDGATGVVDLIAYNEFGKYWYASVMLDKEWIVSEGGKIIHSKPENRGAFWINMKYLSREGDQKHADHVDYHGLHKALEAVQERNIQQSKTIHELSEIRDQHLDRIDQLLVANRDLNRRNNELVDEIRTHTCPVTMQERVRAAAKLLEGL